MNCPICQKTLIKDDDFDDKIGHKELICPTYVYFPDRTKLPHYRDSTISPTNRYMRKVMFILPYRIIETNGVWEICKRYDIPKRDGKDQPSWQWKYVVEVSSFPIVSEDHLRAKLNLYSVFS